MKQGPQWYKRKHRAMLDAIRASRMTDRQIAVYNVVIDLIYEGDGETPNTPEYIAAYFSNVGTTGVRRAIGELIAMGKIHERDGMLTNEVARQDAERRREISEARSQAGKKGGRPGASAEHEGFARGSPEVRERFGRGSGEVRRAPDDNLIDKASKIRGDGQASASRAAKAEKSRVEKSPPLPPNTSLSQLSREPEGVCQTGPEKELVSVIGADLAVAYVEHRRAVNSPLTPFAAQLVAERLRSLKDPKAAVREAIEKGWKGIYDHTDQQQKPPSSGGHDRMLRELRERHQ